MSIKMRTTSRLMSYCIRIPFHTRDDGISAGRRLPFGRSIFGRQIKKDLCRLSGDGLLPRRHLKSLPVAV